MAIKDIKGQKFGKLLVLDYAGSQLGTIMWFCVCDCGSKRTIAGTGLRAGRHKSCGCASPRFTSERMTTHGKSTSRIYRIWVGMKKRCSEKSTGKARKNYFEKGIKVCDEWMIFENFLADMGYPGKHLSIDRKDGTKDYSKDNCRWATSKQQANNMCVNRILEHDGKSATVAEWADLVGIKPNTLEYRILRGWSVERAINQPIRSRSHG